MKELPMPPGMIYDFMAATNTFKMTFRNVNGEDMVFFNKYYTGKLTEEERTLIK